MKWLLRSLKLNGIELNEIEKNTEALRSSEGGRFIKSLLDFGMAELMQLSSRAWSSADGSSSFELTLNELSELLRENVTGVSSTLYE